MQTSHDKLARMRERYPFAFSKSRIGRWHILRIVVVVALAAVLTWYGKHGADNPIGGKKILRVTGTGGGYAVTCVTGRDGRTAAEVRTSGAVEDRIRVSDGEVTFKDIRPLANDASATLLTFAGADIMICDSSIFTALTDSSRSPFKEIFELIIIPPASEDIILRMRDIFRPRYVAAVPPCKVSQSYSNIICNDIDNDSDFKYEFEIRRGKILVL